MTTLSVHLAARAAVAADVAAHLSAIVSAIEEARDAEPSLFPDGLTAVLQNVYVAAGYALKHLPALESSEGQPPT